MCILESCLGQFSGLGAVSVWNIQPKFKGVGIGAMIMTAICCIYYIIIIAYAIYYLLISLPLFWITGTESILPYSDESSFCSNSTLLNSKTCQEFYYDTAILKNSEDYYQGLKNINWPLVATTIIAYIILMYSQLQGTKSTGALSKVTSILPYVCLICLFIGTIRLEGAYAVGIKEYVSVDFKKLNNTDIWRDAAQQIFYSQGMVWGAMINFASHNSYRTDIFNHTWKISLINAFTSIFSGFIVFSTAGFLAFQKYGTVASARANFDKIIQQTFKLAFIVYPAAISKMPCPYLWGIIFFLMLATIGTGTQVGLFMSVYESIVDEFQTCRNNRRKVLIIFILICLAVAFPMLTSSGIQWLEVFDWSVSYFSIYVLGFLELTCISYFYGIDRFIEDIEGMLKFKLPFRSVWRILWLYVTPGICLTLVCLNVRALYKNDMMINKSWPLGANLVVDQGELGLVQTLAQTGAN